MKPQRGDTNLTKDVFRVVIHAVFPEECLKFLLETTLAVVRLLILDVPGYLVEVGGTDDERA